MVFRGSRTYDDYTKSLEDWFKIHGIAKRWGFDCVVGLCLKYIKMKEDAELPDLVDRIVKYEEYAIPLDMMLPLYCKLCTRAEPPEDLECEKLRSMMGFKVFRAREKILKLKVNSGDNRKKLIESIVVETLELAEPSTDASASTAANGECL